MAFLVAAGMLLSRIFGLIRSRVFAHYFGQETDAADVFQAAFRIPNLLQNLFGEGVLSASFIPVYSGLLAHDDEKSAHRLAGAVFALLALTTSVLVLIGVLATPYLIPLIAPGFHGEKRALTILLVRVLFPGAGLLVMSAWCLGILNSHRKFFLSYAAPVMWNLAMIATMMIFGGRMEPPELAVYLGWGSVIGSALQFFVQLPMVLMLIRSFRPNLTVAEEHMRAVLHSFGGVFVSRGVVQLSAYIDQMLASLLGTGPVAALTNAQTLYSLPISLFGMAVSAAELPEMSRQRGHEAEVAEILRTRLNSGLRRIAFFTIPSVMAFWALGDVLSAAVFQTGRFRHSDSLYLWGILAGSGIGLLASTLSRLYTSTYYALRDTRTPFRFAIVRLVITTALGYFCSLHLPGMIGLQQRWGAAGLTASAGLAGWVEFALLRRALSRRIGKTGVQPMLAFQLWCAAGAGAAIAWVVKFAIGPQNPIVGALCILTPFGLIYLGLTWLLQIPEIDSVYTGLARRFGLRKSRS